jgi:streptogramin lyase
MPSVSLSSRVLLSCAALAALGIVSLSLTGCGSGLNNGSLGNVITPPPTGTTNPPPTGTTDPPPTGTTNPPPPPAGTAIAGKALAGTQPIVGSAVQLYAVGSTGNGSAPTAMLSSALTTDSAGAFSIPSSYTCPSSTSQLYVVARGGHVGSSPANSAIVLASALGACGKPASSLVVNEATTAATAWALSQFLASGANLGASATNAQGLANAAAAVASLVNLTTGNSPGTALPSTASSPAQRINTVANLLNSCAAAANSTPCGKLFASTTPSGASAPANTLDAALNLVRHPGSNVAALYALAKTSTAFSPAFGTAPSDWSLYITYTGGGMNAPGSLGVDSNGNVWVASYFGVVSEFSPIGTPLFAKGITGSGLCDSYGLAVDAQNNVWISNQPDSNQAIPSCTTSNLGSVTVLNSSGQPISGANGFTSGGLNYPQGIAFDAKSTAWVVDYGSSHLTLLSSAGQPLSGTSGYTTPLFNFPIVIAIDGSNNGWVANQNGTAVTRVSSDGSQFTNFDCCNSPSGIAVDQHGNVWAANYYGNSVSELSSTGSVISSGYTGGGLDHPQGIAIDGAGNIWVASYRNSTIVELGGAGSSAPGQILSPTTKGWAPEAALLEAYAVAIDASGNLWTTNFGNNTITELVGVAAPVKTPLLGLPQAP